MKITDIQTIPLGYMRDNQPISIRSFALVKVTTDEGIVGYGEASDCFGHSNPLIIKEAVDEGLKRLVLGDDPLNIELIMQKVQRFIYRTLGIQCAIMQALSAV